MPTFQGRITHPGDGVVSPVSNDYEWEVTKLLKIKASKFGYDWNTAEMYRWDANADVINENGVLIGKGDYVKDDAATNKLFSPVAGRAKAAPVRKPPVEDQVMATHEVYSLWQGMARQSAKTELTQEELVTLMQTTIENLFLLGFTAKDIQTTTRQIHESKNKQ